jgi:uncharacterized membrane protein HdeD (DUF308 family)
VIQTLTKNRLLLALCGVLDAMISVVYLIMQGTDGPLLYHTWNGSVVLLGRLALAAGACAIAAGIWRSADGKCWLLAVNGLALGALGLIQYDLMRFPISLLTIALLIILMATTMGALELAVGRTLRPRSAGRWFTGLAGAASAGFALVFLVLGFRWVRLAPGSHADLLWLGAYFGFSAICMLWLAVRLQPSLPDHIPAPGSDPRPRIAPARGV